MKDMELNLAPLGREVLQFRLSALKRAVGKVVVTLEGVCLLFVGSGVG